MSQILADENVELNQRKEQALQLGVNVKGNMSLETLEDEIITKLESGMQDLKAILDEMSLLES